MRTSGILMPISSLPSPWGIGTLGGAARDFIDFLTRSGQTSWQLLPLVPTSFGDSPYQSFSSFAGNPYLIDLDDLAAEGLLRREEYAGRNWGSDPSRVDYGLLYRERFEVLRSAARRLALRAPDELKAFAEREAAWLDDYALFMAIKEAHGGAPWNVWEEPLRRRVPAALGRSRAELADEIAFWKVVQLLFFKQWTRLRARAVAARISIIGDLPIYVAQDSADVWAHPDQFQLDAKLAPIEVAGVPPDGFSPDGQLWGNPLFDWDVMREQKYRWWIERIAFQLRFYDVVRIDHFRGFDSYYAVPAGAATARSGRWRPGPGYDFFRALRASIGECRIIAEDLGFLTDSVRDLLARTGYPGMKVLELAFDSRDSESAGFRPHTYPRNCVAYVGTHDNATAMGWLDTSRPADVALAREYLHLDESEPENWGMMRGIWASVADTAIVQMQDLLGLGSEARMNTPATVGGNWTWRALPGFTDGALAQRLHRQTELYGRLPADDRRPSCEH